MNIALGIILAVVAGTMNGVFPLPMKLNRKWAWENTWFPFSFLSLAVFPWLIAWYTVPHLAATYGGVRSADLAGALLCGIFVYTGSLLFGIAIAHIGVGLSFALLIGTMNAVGVLVPPLLLHRSLLHSRGGAALLSGVLLSILSVLLGFMASRGKQARSADSPTSSRNILGAVLAILGGALSGLLPVGMAMSWSHHLQDSAVKLGSASPAQAGNAVLALVLLGGALPNCGYCAFLLWKKGTYTEYLRYNYLFYWLMVLCMGLLYSVSVALWGVAISPSLLGDLGPSVGWAIFVGMIVLASTATGLMLGEWRGSSRPSKRMLGASVIALISSMLLVCYGTYLH